MSKTCTSCPITLIAEPPRPPHPTDPPSVPGAGTQFTTSWTDCAPKRARCGHGWAPHADAHNAHADDDVPNTGHKGVPIPHPTCTGTAADTNADGHPNRRTFPAPVPPRPYTVVRDRSEHTPKETP
ncbi:hypothetical protein GCM10022240_08520 [Microbacterium kribbense]|uniref:Uncharacterized protein n=1 Tax=Microbacterium kribbense TaxID=433645 RepID=A0ABP7GDA8_9MICO